MTTDSGQSADALFAARVELALSSLEDLRAQLQGRAASGSEIAAEDVARSLTDVWREQRPLLAELAAAVLESLRVQALQQAYGWREQLDRSTDA